MGRKRASERDEDEDRHEDGDEGRDTDGESHTEMDMHIIQVYTAIRGKAMHSCAGTENPVSERLIAHFVHIVLL